MNHKVKIALLVLLIISTLITIPMMSGCTKATPATTSPQAPATQAPATTPAAKVIELKWCMTSTGVNLQSIPYLSELKFTQEVERLSGGRVKFTQLVGSVTPDGVYDGVINKIGDIGGYPIQINTGRFPSLEMMTVPDLFTKCLQPAKVAQEMYNQLPEVQKEFSDVQILTCFALRPSPPGIGFAMRNKPVRTLEDCKGVKMGMYGEWGMKTVNALGFTGVSVPNPAVYENLQKGVVDGSFCDPEFLDSQKVAEVAKYWHSVGILFSPFWWGMNKDTWNSLPADIQKLLIEQAALMPTYIDGPAREAVIKTFAAHPDVTVVEFAPEEQARWRLAQDPVQAEYIASLAKKGIDGEKILAKMNELMTKYANE